MAHVRGPIPRHRPSVFFGSRQQTPDTDRHSNATAGRTDAGRPRQRLGPSWVAAQLTHPLEGQLTHPVEVQTRCPKHPTQIYNTCDLVPLHRSFLLNLSEHLTNGPSASHSTKQDCVARSRLNKQQTSKIAKCSTHVSLPIGTVCLPVLVDSAPLPPLVLLGSGSPAGGPAISINTPRCGIRPISHVISVQCGVRAVYKRRQLRGRFICGAPRRQRRGDERDAAPARHLRQLWRQA